jgi:hypothetical protein
MNCFIKLSGIATSVLGLATAFNVAQAAADEQGRAAVMTSGNGVAVSGTWDADGFHGVYSGPTGVGRVKQPAARKKPVVKPARAAVIQQGSMIVVGDGDAAAGVSLGGSVGAFAGAGAVAGGAVAISGPEGVAVGVPGAPLLIVGGNVPLRQDARQPVRQRRYRAPKPERQEISEDVQESGRLKANPMPAIQRAAPLPPSLPAPPRPGEPQDL